MPISQCLELQVTGKSELTCNCYIKTGNKKHKEKNIRRGLHSTDDPIQNGIGTEGWPDISKILSYKVATEFKRLRF